MSDQGQGERDDDGDLTDEALSLRFMADALDGFGARLERAELKLENRKRPPKEIQGEDLDDFVRWLCEDYGLTAALDGWQDIPALRHELAGLMRARQLDDGGAFYLVSFHDALARFFDRIALHRTNWKSELAEAQRDERPARRTTPEEHSQAAVERS